MKILQNIKQQILDIKRNREFQLFKEKLYTSYENFTKDKLELTLKGSGTTHYAWIEGKAQDRFNFDYLFILKARHDILSQITIDNFDKINFPYDFTEKYTYNDVLYILTQDCFNEFGISVSTFVIATKQKKYEMQKVKMYFDSPSSPKYCKNLFYDPIFIDEYKKWKKSFLPDIYIEVRFDSANLSSNDNIRNLLNVIGYNGKVYWLWIENDNLCIMPKIPHIGVAKGLFDFKKFDESCIERTKIDDVICFMTLGDIETTQSISGGEISGGGSNLNKAFIGGLLFGATGAIINSREKITSSPIKTDFSKVDKRTVRLIMNNHFYDFLPKEAKIFKNGESKDVATLEAFSSLLPEKDYRILSVSNIKTRKEDNIAKIEQLAELLHKGILTECEFEEKKKELLKKI